MRVATVGLAGMAHRGGDVTVAKIGHPAVGDYADFLCAVFVVSGFFPSSCQRLSVTRRRSVLRRP
jgi:hypothetical protein